MIRKKIEGLFEYCGIKSDRFDLFFMILLYLTFIFSFLTFVLTFNIFLTFSVLLLLPLIFISISYVVLYLISLKRAREMEKILPDFLMNLATNLESGISLSSAIVLSAKPSYGDLSKEFISLSKKSKTSESFYNSILALKRKFRSKKFASAVELISEGWSKGASISRLLFNLASDFKRFDLLEKEKNAEVASQVSFILVTVLFAVPFLFAGSYNFVIGASALKGQPIDSLFLAFYTVAVIIMNSFFGSILISLIKGGEKLEGAVKYFPILSIVSLISYVIMISLFSSVLVP